MDLWSKSLLNDAILAAERLDLAAAPSALDVFLKGALRISLGQEVHLFGETGRIQVTATLTKHRQDKLEKDGEIPSFVIFQDPVDSFQISGMIGYLNYFNTISPNSFQPNVINRLRSYKEITNHLRSMSAGHDLEAVCSAILDGLLDRGFATRGSGDQGVDAIGILDLLKIDSSFIDATVTSHRFGSTKFFAVVSCKQNRIGGKTSRTAINPSFIRELIGGWMLQRSEFSAWKRHGMQLFSPIQMILATTYRLTTESRQLCENVGIQVWDVPQLVFLIACSAPEAVFSNRGMTFSIREFSEWWKSHDRVRQKA